VRLTKKFWGWMIGAAVVVSGCASGSGALQQLAAPAPQPAVPGALPSPSELRQASSALHLAGSQCLDQRGGEPSGTELVFAADDDPKDTSAIPQGFYFAVYAFSQPPQTTAAVTLRFSSNYQNPVWLACANWERDTWDLSPSSFFSNAGYSFGDDPQGISRFISPAGMLAVAVLIPSPNYAVHLQSVDLMIPDTLTGLTASDDRWDGILLNWDQSDDCDGYMILRRTLEQDGPGPWAKLIEDPISRFTSEYMDQNTEGIFDYEYSVQKVYRLFIGNTERLYYGPGALDIGHRQVTSAVAGPLMPVAYWPTSFYNRFALFWTPYNGPGIRGIANNSYPVDNNWNAVNYLGGAPDLELLQEDGLAPAFGLIEGQELNNTVITIGYSTADGLFTQVGDITSDGAAEWSEPVKVRDAGSYFLGFLQLPRRLGALSWNLELQRMELVDSIDLHGRYWYEFQPEDFPWMLVDDRQPAGPVDCSYFIAGEIVSFMDVATNQLVILEHGNNQWFDLSPGVACSPGAKVVWLTSPGYPSSLSVVYIDDQHRRLRLARTRYTGEWLLNEIEDLFIAKGSEQLGEFALFTTGESSYMNYLVYTVNGQLFMMYSNHPGLQLMGSPQLVDDSTDVAGLKLLRVGTPPGGYSSSVLATYFSEDQDGVTRLNFRDLQMLLPPS
jgi:hypothetical protein